MIDPIDNAKTLRKQLHRGIRLHSWNEIILTLALFLLFAFLATQANYLLEAKMIFIDLIR